MKMNAPWKLEIKMQCSRLFPEVGVELKPAAAVHYEGTDVTPPNSKVVFTWSKDLFLPSPLKVWTVIGSSATYIPSKDDVGHCLRLVSYVVDDRGSQMSSSVIMVTSPVRPITPSPRIFVPTPSGLKRLINKPEYAVDNSGFRVLSYNLLADVYVKTGRDQYNHCPDYQLSWDYRRQNLLAEILSYDADILCLQEVQSDHFNNFFQPEFAKFGYSAVYKGKMKSLCTVTEGCATFFRSDRFKLVKNYEVEFEKLAKTMINKLRFESFEQENEAVSRLVKDNVATVLILEEAGNRHSRICVANTHLHSGKGVSDVRLFQVVSLIQGLQKIDSLGIPVLVCGDMNSPPGSDTHEFVTKGKVGYFRQEKKDVLGMSRHLKLNHSMKLANAYSGALDEHENETLDYIFYSENKLKVDGVLEFPFYKSIGKKRQLPTPQWSSDHVSLVANLRIRKAYRTENYSDLPADPWEEPIQPKKITLEARKQQTFKKQNKKHQTNHLKFGPNNMSALDRLIMESLRIPPPVQFLRAGNSFSNHLICSR